MQGITLPDENARGGIVLLSGRQRAGKTTLLLAVRHAAQAAGLTLGGLLSIARFEGSEKVGIAVMDAGSREPPTRAPGRPPTLSSSMSWGHWSCGAGKGGPRCCR